MTRGEARFAHLATLLVGGTGLVYAWMRYLCEPADEFALSNHPLEPDLQAAHIVLAPLLVLSLGLIWHTHVWAKLRANRRGRRPTGWVLALLAFPMTFSGYLLQVTGDEFWRTAWIWIHVGTSLLWIVAYLAHQRTKKKPRPEPTQEDGWKPRANDAFVEPMFEGLGVEGEQLKEKSL